MYILGLLVAIIILILIIDFWSISFLAILKFVAFTAGIVIVGFIAAVDEGSRTLGVLIILFSPVIAIIAVRLTRPSEETLARRAEEKKRARIRAHEKFKSDNSLEIQGIIDAVQRHHAVLASNMERAIVKNDYGSIVKDNRDNVIREFLASTSFGLRALSFKESKKVVLGELMAQRNKSREKGFDLTTLPTDGLAFEHWVARGLKIYGWNAKATSGSGDQGIDVIATKNGKKVGLQCKLFSSPVGNKAVQEAFAGKAFHKTDAVAVISNASYTPSAKKLAADTGVKLLSHHDIPDLYRNMF